MGDQPVARPLPTHRTTQTQNKRTQASMSRVGFEPTIPVFEQATVFINTCNIILVLKIRNLMKLVSLLPQKMMVTLTVIKVGTFISCYEAKVNKGQPRLPTSRKLSGMV
jgi:hypothetical protein